MQALLFTLGEIWNQNWMKIKRILAEILLANNILDNKSKTRRETIRFIICKGPEALLKIKGNVKNSA